MNQLDAIYRDGGAERLPASYARASRGRVSLADDWTMDVSALWGAAIGAAGALSAVGLTRWFDIRQLRQLWAHDERVRWLQDRQQAYARLMAALDDWDVAVDKAVAERHTDAVAGERREYDSAEWDELRRAARAAQGVVELMAPESVRGPARSAVVRRQAIWMLYLTVEDADLSKMDEERSTVRKVTRGLRDAMRGDLGLEPDEDGGPRQIGRGSG